MRDDSGSRKAPVIAVTAGDPCGIGPEVLLKALQEPLALGAARLVIIGDQTVFAQAARRMHQRLPAWTLLGPGAPWPPVPPALSLLDGGGSIAHRPGRPTSAAGRASLGYLDAAVRLWRQGRMSALVTAPVTKWAIRRLQPGFIGQTEYLTRAMGARDVVMLFVSDRLRIALLTRHVPLARVSQAVDRRLVRTTLRLIHQALAACFGVARPRLALCGINPHAGEAARDSEEHTVLAPALAALRREGIRCEGPFAADGFFAQDRLAAYDAVICSYHDQGLIPFKMAARDAGCQMSLGLPIVRTSPDHGSALDIAGRGIARAGSMRYALRLAARLAASGGAPPAIPGLHVRRPSTRFARSGRPLDAAGATSRARRSRPTCPERSRGRPGPESRGRFPLTPRPRRVGATGG
jgi:4-hydroxythreonine-4-phosphate dehydrogenase